MAGLYFEHPIGNRGALVLDELFPSFISQHSEEGTGRIVVMQASRFTQTECKVSELGSEHSISLLFFLYCKHTALSCLV